MAKIFIVLGSICASIGIVLGAFGAHWLKDKLAADMMAVYQTAVQYHLIHAIGLIMIGAILLRLEGSGLAIWAGWMLFGGIIIFSGSLYILSFTGVKAFGAITPFGGVAFIIGWILLTLAAWNNL